ncbi:redoxin family protein [Sphingomonas jatrophae]|uniref:Cytochrome c biogenesis protein CcmG, thiol:disulfide interchange protein DsbE n=1 Tax=Sphingomonas jatrophae TaxID=1166337 RepID=A0A1I6JCC5_9SPHN|nr:redoxin family protein [Sphingomonas jatrophae]SFR76586.1 cytochrome c biogenesis protein CcmG, thiol:disulfide interchange protein DsbE [Sphingomonas jatrophae]
MALKTIRWLLWVPLILFVGFVALVASGLVTPSTHEIRSQLIGKPLPDFALPPALPAKPGLARVELGQGKPRLVNIFASWCVPCATESAQLATLKRAGVEIDGIAIRDRPEDLTRFLGRYGDPYARIGADRDSSVQMALGSSGVPETFVIDGAGVIRLQHVGEIRPEHVAGILAAVEAAK